MKIKTSNIELGEEIIALDEEEYEEGEEDEEASVNIPLNGSPLYPRIFTGDSAKPLMGQFHESEWVDDNISRTWLGLMSYYG